MSEQRPDRSTEGGRDDSPVSPGDPETSGSVDYRFTLANERTFLAWMRTCLALLAAAVAVIQFAPNLGSEAFRELCSLLFAVLAVTAAGGGLLRWIAVQRAMAEGRHVGRGLLPVLLAVGLILVGLALAGVLAIALGA